MTNQYLPPATTSECTGCGACLKICPQSAIDFVSDQAGFPFPVIRKDKCIQCGLCERSCPVSNPLKMAPILDAYAAQNKDRGVLFKSSSGGVFTTLAQLVLEEGGVVYGCVWDKGYNAIICKAEDENDLAAMRGSKYVWSYAGDTFPEIKEYLNAGRKVLFSGLPCQAAGLKGYLKKEYENLFILDCLCSGAPSPMAFQKFIDMISAKENRENLNLQFRDKSELGVGVHITYSGKKKDIFPRAQFISNPYYYAFYEHLIDRECCYKCPYGSVLRISDITMGDYWGINKYHSDMDIRAGVSALMVNTEKGREIIEKVRDQLELIPTTTDNIGKANNLRKVGNERARNIPAIREKLLSEVAAKGWKVANREYLHTTKRFKQLLRASCPPQLAKMIKKVTGVK